MHLLKKNVKSYWVYSSNFDPYIMNTINNQLDSNISVSYADLLLDHFTDWRIFFLTY